MTEVATFEAPGVPDLVHNSAVEIGSDDIALPRLKVGSGVGPHAAAGLTKPGQIFSAFSEDDADVLYEHGDETGVLFHVIGLRKGKSLNVDGDLMTWAFNDPDAPKDAWVTYNYVLCLPEHDTDVPYKFLMTKSAMPTARALNLLLKKSEAHGPSYKVAFRMTTAKKTNAKGTWFIPTVRPAEATDDGIAAAAKLAAMISDALPSEAVPTTAADAPSI